MSRTFKDKPSKLLWGDYSQDFIYTEGYSYRLGKTTKPKLKKSVNNEWAWYRGTPSWWNNLFHTRPIRGNFQKYFRKVVNTKLVDIPYMMEPSDSKKPHKYYY